MLSPITDEVGSRLRRSVHKSMSRRLVALGVLGVFLLSSLVLHAQQSDDDLLTTVRSLNCEFPVHATGTWTIGTAQDQENAEAFSLRFESIHAEEGTAQVRGAFSVADITARLSAGDLHLFQVLPHGPLYMTTVFSAAIRGGRLRAVHSRHEFTNDSQPSLSLRPRQYYGECELEG